MIRPSFKRLGAALGFGAALCLVATLSACDSSQDEAFSLTVTVRDVSGVPVVGAPVSIRFFPGTQRLTDGLASRSPADLSAVFPTPFQRDAQFSLRLPTASPVRIELLDVLGARQRLVQDGPLAANAYSFRFLSEDDAGRDLPGGAYVVRAIIGADTLRRTTIHTDIDGTQGDYRSAGRVLGTTGANGRIETTDRTAAPGLFLAGVEVPATDENGGTLAMLRFGTGVEVVDEDGAGGVLARTAVTLRDGPNTVAVQIRSGR